MLCCGIKMRCCVGVMLILMQNGSLVAMQQTQPIKAKVLIYLDIAAWADSLDKSLKEKKWFKTRSLIEFLDSVVNPISLARVVSEQGETLLMMAAYFDTVPTIQRILRYIRPNDLINYVNARDKNGYTALDYAALLHRMKTIEALRPYASQETMAHVEKVLHETDSSAALLCLDSGALMCLSGQKGISHKDPSDDDDEKIEKIK